MKVHGSRFGRAGIPDVIACYRGRFIAIEVKRPGSGSQTTKLQDHEIAMIKRAHGEALVATCPETVEGLLDAIDAELVPTP